MAVPGPCSSSGAAAKNDQLHARPFHPRTVSLGAFPTEHSNDEVCVRACVRMRARVCGGRATCSSGGGWAGPPGSNMTLLRTSACHALGYSGGEICVRGRFCGDNFVFSLWCRSLPPKNFFRAFLGPSCSLCTLSDVVALLSAVSPSVTSVHLAPFLFYL